MTKIKLQESESLQLQLSSLQRKGTAVTADRERDWEKAEEYKRRYVKDLFCVPPGILLSFLFCYFCVKLCAFGWALTITPSPPKKKQLIFTPLLGRISFFFLALLLISVSKNVSQKAKQNKTYK